MRPRPQRRIETLSCTNDEIFPDATCQPSRILLRGIDGRLRLLGEALSRLSGLTHRMDSRSAGDVLGFIAS
jgi:hypothetical protein